MNWTEQEIQTAWERGVAVPGFKAEVWRKDKYGAWISRRHYGNRNSPFGWEIVSPETAENVQPAGADDLNPLQWKNAGLNSNGHPVRPVTAFGGVNINLDSL